jgi:radical SAM/Cys-rich protein
MNNLQRANVPEIPTNAFDLALSRHGLPELRAGTVSTVQLNLGLRCNLACAHCHLGAHPARTEMMTDEVIAAVLDRVARRPGLLFDLTGGSPELHPRLPHLIAELRRRGHDVQVRTNLAVLNEEPCRDLPAFYRDHGVRLAASMPCYLEANVRAQRGGGAFEASIETLRRLNALGYGSDPGLPLALVYNPGGPFLPPDQTTLEAAYRKEFAERYGIVFTRLLTITNLPMGRFLASLESTGRADAYREILRNAFNSATVAGLMCRGLFSVAWDGTLADCDFNLALGLPLAPSTCRNVRDFSWEAVEGRPVVTGPHCFGCTAGAGSSCGGALFASDAA